MHHFIRNFAPPVVAFSLSLLLLLVADQLVAQQEAPDAAAKTEPHPAPVPAVKAGPESEMKDESKPADSLAEESTPAQGGDAEDADDCSLSFAEMRDERREEGARGEVTVFSGFNLHFTTQEETAEESPYAVVSTMVMPGEKITFYVTGVEKEESFSAATEKGTLTKVEDHKWTWEAPEISGHYCITVKRGSSADVACLQAFVLEPYNGEEVLNGFAIGKYPESTNTTDPVKRRPQGFVEVTEENLDTWISPRFQLRQFLCKGYTGYPQYVIIRPRLLHRLEQLADELKLKGLPSDDIYVMSAFRTPWYNAKIGNKTTLSRHTFGDAADIFVDADRDGAMDDLNKDGKADDEDARFLMGIIRELDRSGWRKNLAGGLHLYPKKDGRGPFVHVDTRGQDVTW